MTYARRMAVRVEAKMWGGLSMHEAVEALITEVIEDCAEKADRYDLETLAAEIRSLATTDKT